MKELDPRIRIRAPLRCDGIGRLDCAEDTVSGDRLAVRWLPLDANGDAAVKACEKLPQHPTLPRILQTGTVGTSAFVALDFPEGEMLSAQGEERLDNDLLLKLAAQLSDALATVHAQGVVHGEMSRDSVLLVPGGKAQLWDMPLVIANRLSDRRGENRLMQNLVKTAPYLAPERARGEGASKAGDVYSLGAILCVSAGAPLPTAATTLGVVNQIASGEWAPRVPATLPERWRTMVERMVSREASARPTALEVAMAFSTVPGQGALPTVPELPAVRLPPEILAAADALMREQVEAMRAPTREMPLVDVAAQAEASRVEEKAPSVTLPEFPAAVAEVAAPLPELAPVALVPQQPVLAAGELALAVDPVPEFKMTTSSVHPHTLDEVSDTSSPDVVRIPTMELKAIAAETAAAPVAPPPLPVAPSVALADNIAVAADFAAHATSISAEELAAIQAGSRRVWMVFGGIAGAALALITVVVMLATSKPDVVVTTPVAAPKPVVAPVVKASSVDESELVPLPKLAPKAVVAPKPTAVPTTVLPAPRPEPVATDATAPTVAAEPAKVETVEPKPTTTSDFSFLESAEAPKSELKRPPSEL